jgi:hypothetical protein
MPNWVDTTMVVTGPAEDIAKFKELAKSGEDALSFDNLVPMPEELRGVSAPANIISQEEYDDYIKRKEDGELGETEAMLGNPITPEMSERFTKEFGADNWYDWNNHNIGTKWGFCDSELFSESETELRYSYQTAWSPAEEGLLNVSKKFPTLLFQTYMEEESNDFNGRMDYQDGRTVFEELHRDILTEDTVEILEEIAELEQEEAIKQYKDYERDHFYDDHIMNAIEERMEGNEITVPDSKVEHLRL